ncbi:MAG: alpha/beta hydrolase [Herbiconiux sp.]|uniref:alpha/beta hydrolase n=1 Tax=Herbiconiux sp. TaxID=1871186 RepID=UPI00120CD107|nr:alpha/beta hydrolase [Herbiconiux sp.]TAJ50175.1 MAG: alpha/beta hydrolase [Herbiconiux sp.]
MADELERVFDIPYKEVDGNPLTLDLYYTGKPDDHPVLLWFHGGGWRVGHSRQAEEKILWPYAQAGLTVVTVNYRLSGEAAHPAQLEDALDALAWLGRDDHGYRFDTDSVIVGGGSAGGHIAALVAVNHPLYRVAHGETAPWVKGAVALYPVVNPLAYDGAKLAQGAPAEGTFAAAHFEREGQLIQAGRQLLGDQPVHSPSAFLDSYRQLDAGDVPPVLILHGSNDSDVPVAQSLLLYDTLRAQGIDVTLLLFGDADHGSPRFHRDVALAATVAFASQSVRPTPVAHAQN